MTRPTLTKIEQAVFDLIRAELVAGRQAPTYDELLDATTYTSKGNLHRIVSQIISKGWLVRMANRKRALALAPDAETYTVHLPVELDAQLRAHLAVWGATAQCVITKALADYLARQP